MIKLPEKFVPQTPGQEFKLEVLRDMEAAGRGKHPLANQLRDELVQETKSPEELRLIAGMGGPRG